MFVDDVNMPRVDTYGTQQPIALLKLFVERKGFYDRGKELSWKNVKDVQMVGAMGPPGGARNNVDPRFISLFSMFEIQAPSNSNLRTIYQVCCDQSELTAHMGDSSVQSEACCLLMQQVLDAQEVLLCGYPVRLAPQAVLVPPPRSALECPHYCLLVVPCHRLSLASTWHS